MSTTITKNGTFKSVLNWMFEVFLLCLVSSPLAIFIMLLTGNSLNSNESSAIYLFKDLVGPKNTTEIPDEISTSYQRYNLGGSARLAILLTDESSHWLGLAHGLESIGIPFMITRDYKEAIKHKVVMVYPSISSHLMGKAAYEAITQLPNKGATLIGFNVEGGSLNALFSFKKAKVSNDRGMIYMNSSFPLTRDMNHPKEQVIPIDNLNGDDSQKDGTIAYEGANLNLAKYEDGRAAIVGKESPHGNAYAFGFDLGHLILLGYNNRQQNISRSYNNQFEPVIDVFLRLLMNIYERDEPLAVTLSPVPFGKDLTMIWTHDIDYTRSLINAVEYAKLESRYGIHGTYFTQTKYVRDWNDEIFFNDDARDYLKKINDLGGEIASHTVSHSQSFAHFPLGTGAEQYPEYRPKVLSEENTTGGSVLGELRVSRFLLEQLVPEQHVDSFRPGHLKNPYELPQALKASDYRYSSSVTANDSLTHLPFRLTYGRNWSSQTDIFEFPVSIEDEESPDLLERLPNSIELSKNISRYGGLVVVLTHPDITGRKIEFEEKLINAFIDRAYMPSLREYGAFWTGRVKSQVDVETRDSRSQKLSIDMPMSTQGLTLRLPPAYSVSHVDPPQVEYEQSGRILIIRKSVPGITTFDLKRTSRSRKGYITDHANFATHEH
jgi:hypothetical protein